MADRTLPSVSASVEQCDAFAAALAHADTPDQLLDAPLPCPPLAIVRALHRLVMRWQLADLQRAQHIAQMARTVATRFPDTPLVQAQARWSQGSAIIFQPDYLAALAHYDAALEYYERACEQLAPAEPELDVRIVQINRLFCLSELGRYHEAREAADAFAAWLADHPNDGLQLKLLVNRTQLAGVMGSYAEMAELAIEAITLATHLDEPAETAKSWINRAYACISLGRYAEAEVALAAGTQAAAYAEEPLTLARAELNCAWLLRCQGQLFEALRVLRKARNALAQAEGEAATVALEEALVYERLYQLTEAHAAARRAAEEYTRQSMTAYSATAAIKAARIAVRQRYPRTAHALLTMARTHAERVQLPLLHAEVDLAAAELATLHDTKTSLRVTERNRRDARAHARKAVVSFEANGLRQEAAEGRLVIALLDALLGQIDPAIISYQELTAEPDVQVQLQAHAAMGTLLPGEAALPHLERAAELAVAQRRRLPMEELQARYSSETYPHHIHLAAAHLARGQLESAFERVCDAKGGALLDLRAGPADVGADGYATLDLFKSTIVRWCEQEYEHAHLAALAHEEGHRERQAAHLRQAETARAERSACEQQLTAELRTLGDRNGQADIPSTASIVAALHPEMALIEYAQLDDDLVAFVARPGRPLAYRTLGPYAALVTLLDRWSLVRHRMLTSQHQSGASDQIASVLAPLRSILLDPCEELLQGASQLVIAPYGALHQVPWAALPCGAATLADYFTLTLTPCSAFWAASRQGAHVTPGPARLLGWSGTGARRLAHIQSEIVTIARHLPDAEISLAATSGDLRRFPPPQILHVAAHAQTNAAAPLSSTLDLADQPFTLLEAHRLDLRGTKLVTLSACETGVRPEYGDMALALAGAFLCAGADQVLASLWAVTDAAAADLMERLYAALAQSAPPATALRLAQQQIRSAYPLDWAAFQLWSGTHVADLLPGVAGEKCAGDGSRKC